MARKVGKKELYSPSPNLIGEGATERWYFFHLRNMFEFRVKIRPRFFKGGDIGTLSKLIKTVLDEGNEAIVVFDADVSARNPIEGKRLNAIRKLYTHNEKVLLCDSMPSIEYWFLLHYKKTNAPFPNAAAVTNVLKNYIRNFDKNNDFLKKDKWVKDMSGSNRLQSAIQNAKSFGTAGHSYSNVWKAIEKIANN